MPDSKGPDEWSGKNTAIAIAVGVGYLVLGLSLWLILNGYIDPSAIKDPYKEATAKRDLVQALGLIMAGVAGAVGIIFTWRNLQQGQANLRLTQEDMKQTQEGTRQSLQLTLAQLRLTRQSQITERFTRASDQLGRTDENGNKLVEVRVASIYALEQIAEEADEYYWTIMKLLIAYHRQHAPWSRDQHLEEDRDIDKDIFQQENEALNEFRPAPDIEASSDVIRRRSRHDMYSQSDFLDLTRLDLRKAHLGEAHLEWARFELSNLRMIHLRHAHLENANFYRAVLRYAWLQNAHCQEAAFEGADAQTADLSGAVLDGANLQDTNLRLADLSGTSLKGATLRGANLQGALLEKAKLEEADLKGTNLETVRHLTKEQLEQAIGDRSIRLPDGLKHPAHWEVQDDEQSEGS